MAPRIGRRPIATLVAIAAGWIPGPAAAQPAQQGLAVHVRYQAPAGCPTLDEISGLLLARAPSARLVDAAEAARVFAIEIRGADVGYLGTLEVHRGDQVSSRTLSAPRCDDVATALALVAALAIEREAPRVPPPIVAPPPVAPSPGPFTAAIEVGSGLLAGAAPDPMWVAAVDGRLLRAGTGQIGVALAVGRDDHDLDDGRVSFTLAAARIAACWTPWSRWFEVDTCAHVEVGGLRASGHDIVNGRDVGRFWSAAGIHGALRWPTGTRLFGELRPGLSIPLIRDNFYFDPGVMVHQASSLTPWVLVGGGARFR